MMLVGFLLAGLASLAAAEPIESRSGIREECPVTLPPVRPFIPPPPYAALPESPQHFWLGTSALWVMPRVDGTWRGQRTALGYRDKLFLWRPGFDGRVEQQPEVTVVAKRLDDEMPPYVVSRATNALLPSGEWTMLTALDIPSVGCWQLSAQYQGTTVAWIVWVVD
jgi:hypothetical protein